MKGAVMESLKKNALNWAMLLILPALGSALMLAPQVKQFIHDHEKDHSRLEHQMNLYVSQLSRQSNTLARVEQKVNSIDQVANTKVRSVEGRIDAQEYRLRQLEK